MGKQKQHEQALRHAIVKAGRSLYRGGLIAGGDGNISAVLDAERLLITPSGLAKGRLQPADLVIIDRDGHLLAAHHGRTVSSEYRLHLQVYRLRPEVQAVVHAHPPTAVGATLAGVDLTRPLLPEALIALGPLPTAPYGLTGTDELANSIAALIANHDAIMLAYHGALTCGRSVEAALMAMEQVEHCAKILLAAAQFGGAKELPPERVRELLAINARLRGLPLPTETQEEDL